MNNKNLDVHTTEKVPPRENVTMLPTHRGWYSS